MKNVKEIEKTIEGETWAKALDRTFEKKVKTVEVDGFRKGKCPKDVYLKKFGIESLYMDAVDLVINDAYHSVLEDEKLEPACEPAVDILKIDKDAVTFKFTIIEKPEVKLGKYKKLGVKKEEAKVTENEINEEIKHLQDRFADIIENNDGTLENGNTATINFEGTVDGEKLEGGTGENYPLEIGSNTFIPGFEEGLIGMKVGEERTLNLKFPEEYVDNLKGKDVVFKVTLTGIKKRVLPELNEDFYKDLGYDDVKDEKTFKERVKAHLLEHKETDIDNKFADELVKKAIETLEVEINDEIIDDEVNRMINDYRKQLSMQGITLEQYLEFTKGSMDKFKDMMKDEATRRIKTRYLLEEIANKEKIEVTHDEIHDEIHKIAETYKVEEDEVLAQIGGEEAILYELKMQKAINFLKENN